MLAYTNKHTILRFINNTISVVLTKLQIFKLLKQNFLLLKGRDRFSLRWRNKQAKRDEVPCPMRSKEIVRSCKYIKHTYIVRRYL